MGGGKVGEERGERRKERGGRKKKKLVKYIIRLHLCNSLMNFLLRIYTFFHKYILVPTFLLFYI